MILFLSLCLILGGCSGQIEQESTEHQRYVGSYRCMSGKLVLEAGDEAKPEEVAGYNGNGVSCSDEEEGMYISPVFLTY